MYPRKSDDLPPDFYGMPPMPKFSNVLPSLISQEEGFSDQDYVFMMRDVFRSLLNQFGCKEQLLKSDDWAKKKRWLVAIVGELRAEKILKDLESSQK